MLPKEVFLFWKLCSRWKLQPLCVCPQKVLILQRNLVMVGLLTGIPCRGFSLNFHQGLETFRLAWGKMGRKLMQPLPRNSSFMRSLSCWELLSILLAPVYLTGPSSAFLSWGWGALAALRSSHPLAPLPSAAPGDSDFLYEEPFVAGIPQEPPGAAAAPGALPQPVPPCISSLETHCYAGNQKFPHSPSGILIDFYGL